jgi:hypothetical protein
MSVLAAQRCFHHAAREAAARCPECGRYYCRECVSDHEGRVLCATCLAKFTVAPPSPSRLRALVLTLAPALVAFVVLWFSFYLVGYVLSAIPASFHEGTIWQKIVPTEP